MLRLPQAILFLLAVAGAAIWLSQTWSPSSYGLGLRNLGATDAGIVLGTPRPTSDEWGQVTPLIQATVNNGLERYNKTSYYGEDLRIVHSLPVLDWGLVFKPDKWLYPFVNAAYAYSYQWLFWLCAFVVGYALLFRRLGRPLAESAALSLALLFTAFVQFWWMLFAPVLALFPWMVLALDIEKRWLQFAAIVWLAASWMLGYFYPPLLIPGVRRRRDRVPPACRRCDPRQAVGAGAGGDLRVRPRGVLSPGHAGGHREHPVARRAPVERWRGHVRLALLAVASRFSAPSCCSGGA